MGHHVHGRFLLGLLGCLLSGGCGVIPPALDRCKAACAAAGDAQGYP